MFCVKYLVEKKRVTIKHCSTEKMSADFSLIHCKEIFSPDQKHHSRGETFDIFDGHATVAIKGAC